MGQWPGVFRELVRFQHPDIAYTLDRPRPEVCREFLVTEDCKTFFQAELKPVTAGDAVAGPVMEIFVGNDRLDRGIIRVSRCFGPRKNELVVEDIEALVF